MTIKTRLFLVALACTAPIAASADEFGLRDSALGGGWVFSPYGRLNQAVQSVDDGAVTTTNIVDISGSASRIGFFVRQPDATHGVSFQFETGLGLRASSQTSQIYTPPAFDWDKRQLRQVQVIWSGPIGTFRAGQGSMATDGVAEIDLGHTTVLAKSTIPEMYGAYIFRSSAGPLSTVTIGQTFNNYDGVRRFRLRYDSPDFSGFSLSAAYGSEVLTSGVNDRYYDFALRYGGEIDRLKLSAGIGTSYTNSTTAVTHATTGSVSVLDPGTGLNMTLAAGQSGSGTKAGYLWLKGGWNADLFATGVTRFLIEGFWGNDYVTTGSDSQMWGVGVMQRIDQYNLELFAGYREFSYADLTPTTYRDMAGLQVGAEIKF